MPAPTHPYPALPAPPPPPPPLPHPPTPRKDFQADTEIDKLPETNSTTLFPCHKLPLFFVSVCTPPSPPPTKFPLHPPSSSPPPPSRLPSTARGDPHEECRVGEATLSNFSSECVSKHNCDLVRVRLACPQKVITTPLIAACAEKVISTSH